MQADDGRMQILKSNCTAMKKIVSVVVFLLWITQPGKTQALMFRGTPDHTSNYTDGKEIAFTDEAWSFNARAPIRSTAVSSGTTVFFGSSDGKFYALDKQTGKAKWVYNSGSSVESSPALNKGKVFFANNDQSLFALGALTGKLIWKYSFGENRDYDWGFDYYYSSPTLSNGFIVIGAKDGFVYKLNEANGKPVWKFKTEGIVRSTPAVDGNKIFFGDTDGLLYALDFTSGSELWRFATVGNGLKNEDFGFDRRAIISSPTVKSDKVFAGCRDGFFYAVNKNTGKEIWRVDHEVSWVISSLAVKDTILVAGTSDGRFVQAVSSNTGNQLWKTRTASIVWSSPIIHNNKVYIGSGEGVLYCLDLYTGKILNRFQTAGSIFSSPVVSDSMLFFGSDDGKFYALKSGLPHPSPKNLKRFVFYEPGVNNYFRGGTDAKLRTYFASNGYSVLNAAKLDSVLKTSGTNSVIVFAANYFPKNILEGYKNSSLRKYLDNGGRIVICGLNPVIARYDENKNLNGFNFLVADSILGIHYGPNDLRSHKGIYPSFATAEGKKWGMKDFWISALGLDPKQADLVLGKNENGLAAAWVKKYNPAKGSGFIQIWLEQDGADDLSYILKVAEYGFE
jgi:outer membrane protein assembly factor BamB